MASHKLAHIELDDMEMMGYSVAGQETVVAMPQLNVCFDIGKAPQQVISVDHVLLSHGHMDHTAGIAYYLSHRNFSGQSPGTVLAPKGLVGPLETIIEAWGRLDGNRIPAKLVPISAGDEHKIKPNLFVRAFGTRHNRDSLGYCVLERRKKLKPEYSELNGNEIVELKKQGIEIDYRMEIPLVSYLGDSEYGDFTKLDYVANSRILVTECTFYKDEHVSRARAGKHLHAQDLEQLINQMNNEYVVLIHASQRTPAGLIKKTLRKKLSAENFEKVVLLMDRKNFAGRR